jgi:pimeloyl-ACP methyl ester carboxylesterase
MTRSSVGALTRRSALAGLPLAVVTVGGVRALAAAVDRESWVEVDGARLYLLVRGTDAGAPVLLWLHGGPGGAERPLFRLYNGDLERRFVVAYLDQRGAGRSFDPKADPHSLTVARHLADLDVVVERLRHDLGRRQVILAGHSWGSALGMLYAQAHPEKVAAFVGIGQVTSTVADNAAQLAFVEREARGRGDRRALASLTHIGAPPFTADDEAVVQGLVDRYGGYFHHRPNMAAAMVLAIVRGLVTPTEIGRIIHANNVSLKAMNHELRSLDLTRQVRGLDTPAAFLLGRYDRQADSRLAADYFESLAATRKQLIWFEESAHNAPFEEPAKFNATLPRVLGALGVITRGRKEAA